MKRIKALILFLVLFCCWFKVPTSVFALNYNYARITTDEIYLYKSPTHSADISNIYFELEKTYFVKILETIDDFYKVKYQNVVGYVISNQVSIVNGTPVSPYPENITFQINSALNTKIRTSPKMIDETNVIGVLPSSNLTLSYIGKIKGEESIKTLGSNWFYCCYNYENSGCILGYVYAPLTENLTPIFANTETFPDKTETSETITPELPSETQNLFLVVVMCLPAIIIFIVLVIPFNKKENNNISSKQNKNTRKTSKKDFYEID